MSMVKARQGNPSKKSAIIDIILGTGAQQTDATLSLQSISAPHILKNGGGGDDLPQSDAIVVKASATGLRSEFDPLHEVGPLPQNLRKLWNLNRFARQQQRNDTCIRAGAGADRRLIPWLNQVGADARSRSFSATKAPARVNRTAKILELVTGVMALVGAPVIMIGGFVLFGTFAAAQFRIHNFAEDYTSGVIAALVLLALIYFWPVPAAHRRVLMLLWLVRTGVTLGVMLAFEAGYGLDAKWYYVSGKALNNPVALLEFGAGTQNIRALVGLLSYVTDAYSSMKVIFSYVGLIAIYIFYRSAVICLGRENIVVLYALGLLPSLLFWSSILGKDPIVLLGIAIYCYGVAGLIVRQKITMLLYVAIGLFIASFIRVWLGVIFVTPLIITYVMSGRSSALTKLMFLLIAVPGFLLTLQGFSEQFSLETTQDLVTRTDQISGAWARGGSAQQIEGGFTSIRSMIAFMPIGAFTALFRPLPFEISNAFGMLAGLENAFLLSLFVVGLMRRGLGCFRQPVLLWALTTLLVWSAVYGFASYQNLGSAFRFRVQVVPILLLLGLYLTYAHHLGHRRYLGLKFGPVPPSQDQPPAPGPES